MTLNELKWPAIYVALKLVMLPFVLLPLPLAAAVGRRIGSLLYHLLGKWRRLGIETVTTLLPYMEAQPLWPGERSAEEIVRQVFMNSGILLAELSKLCAGRDEELLRTVEFRGAEHYENARAQGRGVFFFTAHSGNWELMALAFAKRFSPVAVVARTMKKGYFDDFLERIRFRHGNRVIYRDNSVREILATLKAQGTVGILPDQAVRPPHGILVDFLGRPAWTTFVPVKMALRSGAPLLPIFIHREGERNIVTFYPALEFLASGSEEERILDGTRKMNRAIEQHILRYPTQWNWLYRRWKGTEELQAELQRQREAAACVRP